MLPKISKNQTNRAKVLLRYGEIENKQKTKKEMVKKC